MVKFADYQLGQLRKIAFQYNEQLRIKDVSKISKSDLVKALEERLELNEDGTKIRVKAIDISNPEVAELSTAVVKEVLKQRLPDVLNYKNGETEEGFLTPMPSNPERSYKTRMYYSDGDLKGKIIYYFEKQANGTWDEVDEEYLFKTLERLLIHSKFPSGVVVRELSTEEGYGLYQAEVKAELENKAYWIRIILDAFSKTVIDNNLPTIRVNIIDYLSRQVLMKTLMTSTEKWTILDLKKGIPQPNTMSAEEMRQELQAPPPKPVALPKEKAPPKPKKATASAPEQDVAETLKQKKETLAKKAQKEPMRSNDEIWEEVKKKYKENLKSYNELSREEQAKIPEPNLLPRSLYFETPKVRETTLRNVAISNRLLGYTQEEVIWHIRSGSYDYKKTKMDEWGITFEDLRRFEKDLIYDSGLYRKRTSEEEEEFKAQKAPKEAPAPAPKEAPAPAPKEAPAPAPKEAPAPAPKEAPAPKAEVKKIRDKKSYFSKVVETAYSDIDFVLENVELYTKKDQKEATKLKAELDAIWNKDWKVGEDYTSRILEITSKATAL